MIKSLSLAFEEIFESDIPALTSIMKRAFDEDSKRHLGVEGGPPGYDNGDFLREFALHPDSDACKILLDNRIVGAFIVWPMADNTCFLGNIFLDPDSQNRGIGSKVFRAIEARYPNSKLWKTETPAFSLHNHYFYVNKCGFSIVRIENREDGPMANYLMEKRIK